MNNNNKIRKILNSPDIPHELEPEQIRIMLENESYTKSCRKKPAHGRQYIRIIAGLAACAVMSTAGIYFINSNAPSEDIENIPRHNMKPYISVHYENETISETVMGSAESEDCVTLKNLSEYSELYELFSENSVTDNAGENSAETEDSSADLTSSNYEYNKYTDLYAVNDSFVFSVSDDNQDIIVSVLNDESYTIDTKCSFLPVQDKEVTYSIFKIEIIENTLAVFTDVIVDESQSYDFSQNKLTILLTYDIDSFYNSDFSEISYTDLYIQEGSAEDVQIIGDNVFILSSLYLSPKSAEDFNSYIPSYIINGEEQTLDSADILFPDSQTVNINGCYKIISRLDVSKSVSQIEDIKMLPFEINDYCFTENNFYIVYGNIDHNNIARFPLNEDTLSPAAYGTFSGVTDFNGQFIPSEYNNSFRMISEYSVSLDQYSRPAYNIYVFDMDMNTIEGTAQDFYDKNIDTLSFISDTIYIQTLGEDSSFFTALLSEPEKISEFSEITSKNVIKQWSDSLMLKADIKTDENGVKLGTSLSMYLTSPSYCPKKTSEIFIDSSITDDYMYSRGGGKVSVLSDPEKNIIGIPLNISPPDKSDPYYQYNIFSYDQTKDEFLLLEAVIRPYNSGIICNSEIIGNNIFITFENEIVIVSTEDFSSVIYQKTYY